MKINYKGQELETITEGYWPDGVTLVCTNDCAQFFKDSSCTEDNVVCLRGENGRYRAIKKNGVVTLAWGYWAVLPPKPAPRRLTNREVYNLWRKGWDFMSWTDKVREPSYDYCQGNRPISTGGKLRAPGSDEWLEPTTDLLEGAE